MTSFQIYEARNAFRLGEYPVDKHTNIRVMAKLLGLDPNKTSLRKICSCLNTNFVSREFYKPSSQPEKIWLHFLDDKKKIEFDSLQGASKFLGAYIKVLTKDYRECYVYHTLLNYFGKRVVLSPFSILPQRDFQPCQENKININLALSHHLNHTIDFNLSMVEMFSLLDLNMPKRNLKKKLCEKLQITYYSKSHSREFYKKKPVRLTSSQETLVFESMSDAAKYLQLSNGVLNSIIEKRYPFPYWSQRYIVTFVD